MAAQGNGTTHTNGNNGKTAPPSSPRTPRRVVLLADGEASAVVEVLAEYTGAEATGTRLHKAVQQFAAEHQSRWVAGEWLGSLGWTRFLWCRK